MFLAVSVSLLAIHGGSCTADDAFATEVLVIPLRVHVLTSETLPEVDCKLSDEDIQRIVGKVNHVWRPAKIHFGLESIVRGPAEPNDRFTPDRLKEDKGQTPLGLFRLLMPKMSRAEDGMNVYYIHKFSVNGVYLGDRIAFVQETARLREVEGGIDEPLPRVTAHELGHALGLPHRQDRTNLLASGTTGTSLNEKEIARAREIAARVPGVLSETEVRKQAEDEKEAGRATILKRWVEEIAGPPAAHLTKDAEGN